MTVSSAGVSLGQGADGDTLGDLTPTKGNVVVGNGTTWSVLGVGTNTHVLTADSAQTLGVKWAAAAAGVSDHGALTGLADDDHAQYVLVDGTRAMTGSLEIQVSSSGATANTTADDLVVETNGATGISLLGGTTDTLTVAFGDSGDNDAGYITYTHHATKDQFKMGVQAIQTVGMELVSSKAQIFLGHLTGVSYSGSYTGTFHVISNASNTFGNFVTTGDLQPYFNRYINAGIGSGTASNWQERTQFDTSTTLKGATTNFMATLDNATHATRKTGFRFNTNWNGGAENQCGKITGAEFVWNTAAVATTATEGFLWIPSCAGVPTGAPTAPYTNAAALVVDTTNSRLYVRVGSTWKYATLT